jgi:hypothetical protein
MFSAMTHTVPYSSSPCLYSLPVFYMCTFILFRLVSIPAVLCYCSVNLLVAWLRLGGVERTGCACTAYAWLDAFVALRRISPWKVVRLTNVCAGSMAGGRQQRR